MIPNGSRNGIKAMQLQTFYATNSVPQRQNKFNGSIWNALEQAVQAVAKSEEIYVVTGVALEAIGVYQSLVDLCGAGATVPLTGFGYCLAKGVAQSVAENGLLGALMGGITSAAGGITAAVFFGTVVAMVFKSKPKS